MLTEEEIKEKEEQAEKEKKEKEALALAEAEKTEDHREQMISRTRFDEVNQKRKDAESALDVIKKEQASQLEQQLEEQGKHEELASERAKKIAELQPVADRVESMEKTLEDNLAAQIEDLPEASQELVPEMGSVQEKLDWLGKHRPRLMKPSAPDIGAGKRGGEEDKSAITLTDEQKAMAKKTNVSDEEYAKNL